MQRILSTELTRHVGETVTVAGWVHRRRLLKSVAFLILRDVAGLTQVVITDVRTRERVEALTEESVVEITATVTANAAPPKGVELVALEVRSGRCTAGGTSPAARRANLGTLRLRPDPNHPRSRVRGAAVRRDPHTEGRGLRDGVGGERVRARLVRPAGLHRITP
jgi:hypothetical protein